MRLLQEYINHAPAVLIVIAIAQVLTGNESGRHTYVVRYRHGDSLIPVTVVLDYKRQTEYVINMNSRTPAKSMTLYDFKERVIVYKDLKNGECFIGRLTHETIQDEDAVLKRLKNPVENEPLILSLEPDRPSLTPTEIRNMAGHKAAVFCRRMNTWTLMPEKNRRERRDTSPRHLRMSVARREHHPRSNRALPQMNEAVKTEQNNADRNRSPRDFSNFQSNGSSITTHHTTDRSDIPPQVSTSDISIEHQLLNNVYPFILPRQQTSTEKKEEKISSRQNPNIYNNTTRKAADDNFLNFGFPHERPDVRTLSEFPQSRPSGKRNGTVVLSSTKRTFIPLNPKHPVIIPSIKFTSKSTEDKVPGVFSGVYQQNTNNFHTPHTREEILGSYPPLHQLPPEAFVLPLTRSSVATTAPPFVFNNRLGYEIVHAGNPRAYNNTDDLLNSLGSLNKSVSNSKSAVTDKSDQGAQNFRQSVINALKNQEVSADTPNAPFHSKNHTWNEKDEISISPGKDLNKPSEIKSFYVDSYVKQIPLRSQDKSSDETEKNSSEENVSPINRLENSEFSLDRSDSLIQIPRWYPEITKQISIPLEIEVLHHEEEYLHGIKNRTEQVFSAGGHEVEDLSPLPNVISVPVETHSNGVKSEKEVKLLPQISSAPDHDSPNESTSQELGRQDVKIGRRPETTGFRQTTYPIYGTRNDISLHEKIPRPMTTAGPHPTNDTEVIDSIRNLSTGSVPAHGSRHNFVNQISHPAPSSHKETFEDTRRTSKSQHQVNGGAQVVHDFKIDEGVPSYRKRFPAVSQLFTPDETIGDVGRLPDRRLRLNQQSPHARRKPSTVWNRTHSTPTRYHSKAAWRKHNLIGSNNLINEQQTRFSNQGITFHHRGYAKPGVPGIPYDHNRKRQGILPPGVSVHPRHPQAPYADLAAETADKTVPVNPLLQSRPRRIHFRHHRRHQRKRNRIPSSTDLGPSAASCCVGDGRNCCPTRRRGRFVKGGCCSQPRENRRPNSTPPSQADENGVSSRRRLEETAEDRCMKEKMCRTVYQSTKKVLVCRNIPVEGC